MKKEELYEVLGDISEKHIAAADAGGSRIRSRFVKWGALAASCAVVLLAVFAVPSLFTDSGIPPVYTETGGTDTTVPDTPKQETETTRNPVQTEGKETSADTGEEEIAFSRRYVYGIPEGNFSSYIPGKVIEFDKIGEKLEETVVRGGWQNREGEWITTEELRAEIYCIKEVSEDIAVALKFIDQGDALTTTHYYVILNPDADQTPMAEYIIPSLVPNLPGDGFGAVPE